MQSILLNEGWQLCEAVLGDTNTAPPNTADWLDAAVPGDIHSTLLAHGRIDDPFYGLGVEKCRWIEEKTWWYRKTFFFEPGNFQKSKLELVFHGLDTLAAVYLNGLLLGEHANMFTPASFDVTDRLHSGSNRIEVRFDPSIVCAEAALSQNPEAEKLWYSYNRGRAWLRKAQYATGWDWGPRIAAAGMWKGVELLICGEARLKSVFFHTSGIEDNTAYVDAAIQVDRFSGNEDLRAVITLSDGSSQLFAGVKLSGCEGTARLVVENPKLWWSNGLGEANLYQAAVTLFSGDTELDSYETEIGIRQLRVVLENDKKEPRFYFELNGRPLFAKGANWIPAHSLPGAIQPEAYREWIQLAKLANMNMLRVWGGGMYESERFYQECDRNGILVWQDFMFACSSYPDFDEGFMKNVREEIEFNVKALRNHPCIALWCGNNEIQWIHGQNQWEKKGKPCYGEKIFHELIPSLLRELDETRLYWPSSPFGGEEPNSDSWGDKHNWQVWAGQIYPREPDEMQRMDNTPEGISFQNYAKDMGLFVSEFGMHAAPVMDTLRNALPEGELYYGSFALRHRNRDKRPDRGVMLMEAYTGQPDSLAQYIDYSMLCQAEGLRFAIEHYRRRFPACGGALLWQLNDCWPALSWSIVDFYRRPKAGYYAVARAFSPVLLSLWDLGGDEVSLWGMNDREETFSDTVEIGLVNFFGGREYASHLWVEIPGGCAKELARFSKNRMNLNYTSFEVLFARAVNTPDINALCYFKINKDLNFPPCILKINVRDLGPQEAEIEVSTDAIARFVRIAAPDGTQLSDNYFDLLPGGRKIVRAVLPQNITPSFAVTALNSGNIRGK